MEVKILFKSVPVNKVPNTHVWPKKFEIFFWYNLILSPFNDEKSNKRVRHFFNRNPF